MLKKTVIVAACAVVLGTGVFWAVFYAALTRPPAGAPSARVRMTIPPGESFSALVDRLADEGLVGSTWAIRYYASATGYDRRIQWGTYEFEPGERPLDILGKLMSGDVLMVDVTIPEGFTVWDIAGAFTAAAVDSVEMLGALRDENALRRRRINTPSLEGYLFPDTYRVPWGVEPESATAMMLGRLDAVFDTSMLERANDLGFTPHEVLTMASIIEAETRVPEERSLVSAVYHNRLSRNMRLEADPTVAYAMGGYKGRLSFADLETESPYNTYRHRGLPPGPICSPGIASIRAALYPDSTSDALYFVARGDGGHVFSRTLREHNLAIERVRRNERARKREGTRSEKNAGGRAGQ